MIVPAAFPANVPIVVGVAKLPAALESWAVKVLVAKNLLGRAEMVKGTETVKPPAGTQNVVDANGGTVIVLLEQVVGVIEKLSTAIPLSEPAMSVVIQLKVNVAQGSIIKPDSVIDLGVTVGVPFVPAATPAWSKPDTTEAPSPVCVTA